MKEVNDVLMLAERLKHLVYSRLAFVSIDIEVDGMQETITCFLN